MLTTPSLPELRLTLVEARSLLRIAERHFKTLAARYELFAIEGHGGWTKDLGSNTEDRARLLRVWLHEDGVYATEEARLEESRHQVELLTAQLENAADAARERYDQVLDRYSAAIVRWEAVESLAAAQHEKWLPWGG